MGRWGIGIAIRLTVAALVTCTGLIAAAALGAPGLVLTFPAQPLSARHRAQPGVDLLMLDAPRQLIINLTRHQANDTSAVWSPDGRLLAFYSARQSGANAAYLYVMTTAGEARRATPDIVLPGRRPAWSPDSTRLVYEVRYSMHTDLNLVDLTLPLGIAGNPLSLANSPFDDGFPAWSPDGSRVAFISWRAGNADIFHVRADGGDLQQLTDDAGWDINPAWSPDGREIAFFSERGGDRNLFVMSVDGQNVRQLTHFSTPDVFSMLPWYAPAWSPDGRFLAVSAILDGDADILIVPREGGAFTRIEQPGRDDLLPDWLPDGEHLVFMTDLSGRWEYGVTVAEWRTGQLRAVMPANLTAAHPPNWSGGYLPLALSFCQAIVPAC